MEEEDVKGKGKKDKQYKQNQQKDEESDSEEDEDNNQQQDKQQTTQNPFRQKLNEILKSKDMFQKGQLKWIMMIFFYYFVL
ncbi:unnamed protein product [Paramecium pentaurelia]|uniref:Uncharacterized protein n=1 Tax=Paramecium pentaurelia TaxID=43138 RepID=A0A8S1SBT8_9CILI|nr:unnamed protein product [Paramecium pentaurelia]